MSELFICGSTSEADTFFCQHVAKRIIEADPSIVLSFVHRFESDYFLTLDELKAKYGSTIPSLMHHQELTLVMLKKDGEARPRYIGGRSQLVDLAEDTYGVKNAGVYNTVIFNREVREESYKLALPIEKTHPIVYIEFEDMSEEGMGLGKIFIELYSDVCPLACENFIKLCTTSSDTSKGYVGCSIHRVVKGGWLQCGDVVDSSGRHSVAHSGSESTDESKALPDESFSVNFANPRGGILGYANSGPHSNGSQFFITLGPCDWMNSKFVGFGRVLQGWSSIRAMEGVECANQTPTRKLTVVKAGMVMDILLDQKD